MRALDKAGIAWSEAFVGGGATAVTAAALAGLAVAPLARRIAPPGLVDLGPAHGLPRLGDVQGDPALKVSDPAKLAALRTLAATFRSVVARFHGNGRRPNLPKQITKKPRNQYICSRVWPI